MCSYSINLDDTESKLYFDKYLFHVVAKNSYQIGVLVQVLRDLTTKVLVRQILFQAILPKQTLEMLILYLVSMFRGNSKL